MKVLVTGGAGFIGSHTAKALRAKGYEPVVYDNLFRGHRGAVRWGDFERGEITDRTRLLEVLRKHDIRAVIHLAALAYVGESMSEPGKYLETNVGGTMALLESMRTAGVDRLVFSSTCATYGVPETLPLTESHPQSPSNLYGETKRMAEKMIAWYGDLFGLQWIALRYFNAAGADPDAETGELHTPETHLLPLAIEAAIDSSQPLRVLGVDYDTADGTAVRDYVHVADLAAAHVLALRRLEAGNPSAAYNLGTGAGVSVRQVIEAVARVSGKKPAVCETGRRAGDPPAVVADASLARQTLGWTPRFTQIERIVETAWNWRLNPLRQVWMEAR
ncbi:MAG: UDP-glucose 4-epimerase GalE [Bryobacteraceae bacterium]|nr:UDP-glucose 4-epimerase GalE [Bryobacteraceae bacterium]